MYATNVVPTLLSDHACKAFELCITSGTGLVQTLPRGTHVQLLYLCSSEKSSLAHCVTMQCNAPFAGTAA